MNSEGRKHTLAKKGEGEGLMIDRKEHLFLGGLAILIPFGARGRLRTGEKQFQGKGENWRRWGRGKMVRWRGKFPKRKTG